MTNQNPVGWFEIYVQDLDRATKFYETVFGTILEKLPMPETNAEGPKLEMMAFPMEQEAAGAPGALVKTEGVPSGGNSTVVYFSSEDCGVEESRIEAAGGTVEVKKMDIGEYGFIVLGKDTEGNMFGVHSVQ